MPRPLLTALLALVFAAALHGQGSLTPPGDPAPTMKTLAQVEPRRPVDALNTPGSEAYVFVIFEPGSYYLTADVVAPAGKSGIGIFASPTGRGVTLDLNGFSIVGPGAATGGSLYGIVSIDSDRPVHVRNGRVLDWPGMGISLGGPGHVLDVVVARTGGRGIFINGGGSSNGGAVASLVERCEVYRTVSSGIFAPRGTVRSCRVDGVVSDGFGASGISAEIVTASSVTNISSGTVGNAVGISASLVTDCAVGNFSSIASSRGIIGDIVTGCQIERTVAGSAGGTTYGIEARQIERCNVLALAANSNSPVIALCGVQVRHSMVERVGNSGTGAVSGITENTVASSGTGTGINLALHAVGNTISGVNGRGITATNGYVRIEGNHILGCTDDGIYSTISGTISGNTVATPSGAIGRGIFAQSGQVMDNFVINFGTGVGLVQNAGIAVRNTVQGGGAFIFGASVRAGPVVSGGGTTAFDANANVDL